MPDKRSNVNLKFRIAQGFLVTNGLLALLAGYLQGRLNQTPLWPVLYLVGGILLTMWFLMTFRKNVREQILRRLAEIEEHPEELVEILPPGASFWYAMAGIYSAAGLVAFLFLRSESFFRVYTYIGILAVAFFILSLLWDSLRKKDNGGKK